MKIFKYQLNPALRKGMIDMPKGAQVLSVQLQHNRPCLWALVDEHAEPEPRDVMIYETGEELTHVFDFFTHVGTFMMGDPCGSYVGHVFVSKA